MVRIKSGGTFYIGDSAVVFIRDLVVEPGGMLIVDRGTHVMFGADDVEIDGFFLASGENAGDKRVVFSSEVSANCVFDMRNHDYLDTRCRIHATGLPATPAFSSIQLTAVDFKDVSLEMTNIRKAPIVDCHFSSNSTLPSDSPGNVWTTQPYLLKHERLTAPTGVWPDYDNLVIQNCWFVDSAASVPVTDNYVPPANRYMLGGVTTTTNSSLVVTGSYFERLQTGIRTTGNGTTRVEYTGFRDSDRGLWAALGNVYTCNDTSNDVEFPVQLTTAGTGTHIDNKFNASRTAFTISNSNAVNVFRNNRFNDYYRAMENDASIAVLTSLLGQQSFIEMYGRNDFAVPDPALYNANPAAHPNPFLRRSVAQYPGDIAAMADLIVTNAGLYALRCGYNAFSALATNHIARFIGGPVAPVDFTDNNARPFAAIRFLNVPVFGAPLNVSQVVEENCDMVPDPGNCSGFTWDTWAPYYGKAGTQNTRMQATTESLSNPVVINKSQMYLVDDVFRRTCGETIVEASSVEVAWLEGSGRRYDSYLQFKSDLFELAVGMYYLAFTVEATMCRTLLLIVP